MAHVIKIQYENSLRRLTWGTESVTAGAPFARLKCRIRELFKLPTAAAVAVTYTDRDGDAVTMASDHDLADALMHQQLNPLRLCVTAAERGSSAELFRVSDPKWFAAEGHPGALELILALNAAVESAAVSPDLKRLIRSAEPLFRGLESPVEVRELMVFLGRLVLSRLQGGWPEVSSPDQVRGLLKGRIPDARSQTEPGVAGKCETEGVTPARAAKEAPAGGPVVHHGVVCDVCGVSPIVGLRWKAIKKHDYDLCPECFSRHGNEDEYTKIDQPMFRPRHCMQQRRSSPGFGPGSTPFDMVCSRQGPAVRRRCGLRGPGGGGGLLLREGLDPLLGGPPGRLLNARFVRDVTILDGTEVAPGSRFKKVWRVRNTGCGRWPADTVLVHVGGETLGQAAVVPVALPPQGVPPSGEMDAAMDFTAPEKPGRYFSYWRLQASACGPKFGHRVWVLIQVATEEALDRARASGALQNTNGNPGPEAKAQMVTPFDVEQRPDVRIGTMGVLSVPVDEAPSPAKSQMVPSDVKRFPPFQIGMVGPMCVPLDEAPTELEPNSAAKEVSNRTEQSTNGAGLEGTIGVYKVEVESDADSVKKEEVANEVDSAPERTIGPDGSVSLENSGSSPSEDSARLSDDEITADQTKDAATAAEEQKGREIVSQEGVQDNALTEEQREEERPASGDLGASDGQTDGEACAAAAAAEDDLSSVEGLLAKLKVMGFTDEKLNRELLDKNGVDLRKTLDDLCAAEEWDPILEELEEMGFYDTSMNRRLMFKNKGSVKRVVKDLVQMDRETSGMAKRMAE